MSSVRLNISLPDEIVAELDAEAGPRQRSHFICDAITSLLKIRRELRLAQEYRQAAKEARQTDQELNGVTSDGLD